MPPRPKVIVTDFIREPLEHERRVLGEIADVIALEAQSEADLEGRIEETDALMMYHFFTLTARTIERLTRCKLIVRCGVGYDNVDVAAARRCGIPVANVPDYGTEEVADSAIGMMLALTRGIMRFNHRMKNAAAPWAYSEAAPLHRLRGRVFGIVGVGRIGTAAALRARALGMDVAYYDPYAPDGRDKALGIRRVEQLDNLLAQTHVLSLHCPLTAETNTLIGARELALMPAGSYLVNTARGRVVDTAAVLESITSGHLAGAALDVLPAEPPPVSDPLITAWRDPSHPAHERVIINPHGAFYCEEGLVEMRIKGSENCLRVLQGLPARNVVS